MQNRTEGTRGGPSEASLLVGRVVDLLSMHIRRSGQRSDPTEFFNLCLTLARCIDCAVANNEVPLKAQDLPILVKQVYKCTNDLSVQAAVMALMISVKNACMIGWFPSKDAGDLLTLAKEIGKTFSNTEDINIEPSYALPAISEVMSRFYPRIKMGHILASLQIKAGYGAFVSDFHILKNMVGIMQKQIGLFVAQTNNMDTSSCIMTPLQANFLLNGKGVQGRNNVSMDTGPQLPTNVTSMLKFGVNLLQAVGQFNGNYLLVIAFMSVMPSTSDTQIIQDYVRPVVTSLDSDPEIIEGSSRVSLNCPISHRRIKTPAKGHLCKHYQCFDYDNFMEMNSRRPSWRCPHCNQSVCHPDMRIDQDIAKILREVGENVVDVIISTDGSWKAVLENEDNTDQTCHVTQSSKRERQYDSGGSSTVPAKVVDLTTEKYNGIDVMGVSEITSRQRFQDNHPAFSVSGNLVQTEVDNLDRMDQNASTQIEENFWLRVLSSIPATSNGPGDTMSTCAGHVIASISELPSSNSMLSPVLTDAVSTVLNQESVDVHGKTVSLSSMQSQLLGPGNLQSRQFRAESLIVRTECGMLPSIPINAGSTSIAAQGLPAPAQVSSSFEQQRTSNSFLPSAPSSANCQSMPFMVPRMNVYDAFDGGIGGMERGQQLLRPLANSFPVSDMALSSMQNHALQQNHHFISGQIAQQAAGSRSFYGHQRPHQFNAPQLRMISAMAQYRNMAPPSLHVQPMQVQQAGGGGQAMYTVNNKQTQLRAVSQPTDQLSRTPPSVPVQLQTCRTGSPLSISMNDEWLRITGDQRGTVGGTTQPVLGTDGSATLASAQSWMPSGRMRGSLRGEAYTAAFTQLMQRLPPVQVSQSSELISTPALQMQGFVATSNNAHFNPQAQTYLRPGGATN